MVFCIHINTKSHPHNSHFFCFLLKILLLSILRNFGIRAFEKSEFGYGKIRTKGKIVNKFVVWSSLLLLLLLLSRFSHVWLCDPIDSSPPGSPVPGILQARTLEWVAISFSNAWKWKVKVKSLSHVWLCATPQTAAYQAPPSMGFSRQEYWSGVPLPSPGVFL